MNELFVNVKVDREERPDVDSIYMQAVQAMNGHGGWPMTVFLTPELEPFWGGTYFPPENRQGMPSFRRVMHAVADAYANRLDDVKRVAATMREMYASTTSRARASGSLSPELLERAQQGLLSAFDAIDGGFGDAPKFPHAMAMEFLLQRWAREANAAARDAVLETFRRMARGGIYDQVGGGFARYSVDAKWLVPHFEKMLYDNALLARLGVHLWQATADDEARRVTDQTLEWLEREMTSPGGGFYSTLDADSEGHEGKFYLWDEPELRALLGPDADAMLAYWGVSATGNFEGRNILHVAQPGQMPPPRLAAAARTLYAARARRVAPGRDEKILASWNGLMLRAVAEAARAFSSARYRALAVRNAEFLAREMLRNGRVFRSHKEGVTRIPGFLEDYAGVALGLLAVYELTFHRRWLDGARDICDAMVHWFWADETGTFFDTASDQQELLARPRDVTDNATPAGTSLAVELLLRLGDLLGRPDYSRRAGQALETIAEPMARYPLAFGHALTCADMVVHGVAEIALIGDPNADDFKALERAIGESYVPSVVLAGSAATDDIELLKDRPMVDGRATAYVCRGYACEAPTTDAVLLRQQLASLAGSEAKRLET